MKKSKIKWLLIPLVSIVFIFSILMIYLPSLNIHETSKTISVSPLFYGNFDYWFLIFVCVAALSVSPVIVYLFFPSFRKAFPISFLLLTICGILILFEPSFYCHLNQEIEATKSFIMILYAIILFICSFVLMVISIIKEELKIRDIIELGMLVAFAVILDLPGLKIRLGTTGGSIGFTMVPLIILSFRMGPIKGFLGCGIIYGLITCITDGWGFVYFPFDYLLAYGSICLVGLFSKFVLPNNSKKFEIKGVLMLILSILIVIFTRLFFHIISGMVVLETDFMGSLIYNAPPVLISGGACVVVMVLLYKPLLNVNFLFNKDKNSLL